MKTRVIQLLNSYYRDEVQKSAGTEDKIEKNLYCTLGYFDAMRVLDASDGDEDVRTIINEAVLEYDGTCNRRNIVCVTELGDQEEQFWKEAENHPYLVLTMVRMSGAEADFYGEFQDNLKKLNKKHGQMAYLSYAHSEMIVASYHDTYATCVQSALELQDTMPVFKSFSVFGIREECLKDCEKLKNETVNIRLGAVVKKRDLAVQFANKLDKELKEKSQPQGYGMKCYNTLGGRDMMIEFNHVNVKDFLWYYRMGRMLTHSNKEYGNAFYNISTEILMIDENSQRDGDDGKDLNS